jgi:hypothetical protein
MQCLHSLFTPFIENHRSLAYWCLSGLKSTFSDLFLLLMTAKHAQSWVLFHYTLFALLIQSNSCLFVIVCLDSIRDFETLLIEGRLKCRFLKHTVFDLIVWTIRFRSKIERVWITHWWLGLSSRSTASINFDSVNYAFNSFISFKRGESSWRTFGSILPLLILRGQMITSLSSSIIENKFRRLFSLV